MGNAEYMGERRRLQIGKESGEMIEGVVLISPSLMAVVPLSAIQTVLISAVLSGDSAVVTRNTVDVLSVFLMQNENYFGHTNVLYCTVLNCIVLYCSLLHCVLCSPVLSSTVQ